jgi:hypothetical protein
MIIQKLSVVISENEGRSIQSEVVLEKLITALSSQALALEKGPRQAISAMEEGLVPLLENVEQNTKVQSESMLRVLEVMTRIERYLSPYTANPRKRLDDHLKEIRRVGA